MADKIVQLKLPLRWWSDPSKWKDPKLPTDLSRPVEDRALYNIYFLSRVVFGNVRTVLSELEQEVLEAYDMAKRLLKTGYTKTDRVAFVADKCKIPYFQVRLILEDIAYVQREHAYYESVQQEVEKMRAEMERDQAAA